ncbi:MAG: anti-sigma factor [Phycisphaerales bacterium]|jgi:hypothetical protein
MTIPSGNHDDLHLDRATGDAPLGDERVVTPEDRAAAALHNALTPAQTMPAPVRARLLSLADSLSSTDARVTHVAHHMSPRPSRRLAPWLIAAAFVLAGGIGLWAGSRAISSQRELESVRMQLTQARQQVAINESLVAKSKELLERQMGLMDETSRGQVELANQLANATARLRDQETQIAKASVRDKELSEQLNEARLTIAKMNEPVDPATLAQNRTKLLTVPDTIRVAWAPFDLPDAPAEQKGVVKGDVTWNDRLQTGYLRFEGLKPNDPKVEQYQVWVIDERGLEQKVSGGVFNASANGEIIVPITPGIDVGKVALFAVTVEKPGGTWVPDLKRRVVVAPRS